MFREIIKIEGGHLRIGSREVAIHRPPELHDQGGRVPANRKKEIMLTKTYNKTRKVWKVDFELPKAECPQGVDTKRVSLAGDFNNWKHSATPMARHHDVFAASLELDPGHSYQFRYLINGKVWCNDWHADTYVPNNFGADNCVLNLPLPDNRSSKK
jgi:hypothetical protein